MEITVVCLRWERWVTEVSHGQAGLVCMVQPDFWVLLGVYACLLENIVPGDFTDSGYQHTEICDLLTFYTGKILAALQIIEIEEH